MFGEYLPNGVAGCRKHLNFTIEEIICDDTVYTVKTGVNIDKERVTNVTEAICSTNQLEYCVYQLVVPSNTTVHCDVMIQGAQSTGRVSIIFFSFFFMIYWFDGIHVIKSGFITDSRKKIPYCRNTEFCYLQEFRKIQNSRL